VREATSELAVVLREATTLQPLRTAATGLSLGTAAAPTLCCQLVQLVIRQMRRRQLLGYDASPGRPAAILARHRQLVGSRVPADAGHHLRGLHLADALLRVRVPHAQLLVAPRTGGVVPCSRGQQQHKSAVSSFTKLRAIGRGERQFWRSCGECGMQLVADCCCYKRPVEEGSLG
jgi:hypothetical protein